MKKILYLAWLGSNNLGDVLMWDVFKQLADQHLDPKTYEVVPSLPGVDLTDLTPYDLVVLGGGSIIHPKYINILANTLALGKKVMIWGSGLDSLDKRDITRYLKQDETISSDPVLPPNIISKLQKIIDSSVYTGIRGPITRQMLQQMGLNVQKVSQSLDPGLLLNPPNLSTTQHNQMKKHKWIGLNWGTSYNKIFGGSEIEVETHLTRLAKKLIQQGYKIYMYLVWWRDERPSLRLYKKINDSKNVVFDNKQYHQTEMIQLMKQCEFTINFKLHANVLSALARVPFTALGYRTKVMDFVLSTGLNNFIALTDEPHLDRILLDNIRKRDRLRKILHKQMDRFVPMAQEHLERPFRNGLYL